MDIPLFIPNLIMKIITIVMHAINVKRTLLCITATRNADHWRYTEKAPSTADWISFTMGNNLYCYKCKCTLPGTNEVADVEIKQDDHQMGQWLTELANKTLKIEQHNGGEFYRIQSRGINNLEIDIYYCKNCYHKAFEPDSKEYDFCYWMDSTIQIIQFIAKFACYLQQLA